MDVDQLFDLLKLENSQQVEKQTLIDLLFQMKLDESQPEFFRIIISQLNAFKPESLSKDGNGKIKDFKSIF